MANNPPGNLKRGLEDRTSRTERDVLSQIRKLRTFSLERFSSTIPHIVFPL